MNALWYVPRLDEQHPASTGYVPSVVAAALHRLDHAHQRAAALPTRTDAEHAVRARKLAIIAGWRARWWDVLARWLPSGDGHPIPMVFATATIHAAAGARDDARFWR